MKEFKFIVAIQVLAIAFLIGITIGSTIQEKKIIQISNQPKLASEEFIMKHAMAFHGTLGAYYDSNKECWYFIDKKKRPCKLFMGVENE